jgi:hypothetical protein
MIRTIVKLAVVALLANGMWHAFGVYAPHYRFKDATQYAAQFRGETSDAVLRDRIVGLAQQFEVPVDEDAIAVSHQGQRTTVQVSYVRPLELVPGLKRPWPMSFTIDVLTLNTPRDDSAPK